MEKFQIDQIVNVFYPDKDVYYPPQIRITGIDTDTSVAFFNDPIGHKGEQKGIGLVYLCPIQESRKTLTINKLNEEYITSSVEDEGFKNNFIRSMELTEKFIDYLDSIGDPYEPNNFSIDELGMVCFSLWKASIRGTKLNITIDGTRRVIIYDHIVDYYVTSSTIKFDIEERSLFLKIMIESFRERIK